ncbi:hypothetical protein QVD17_21079 [Tagetes erecta]|uniref:Uncharacterized protein n=1 Tax=Tagetes erecta TaxID=13708 RepID=A0AAD8KMW6_TARER|nr:hypothetical protein QVD17_21079 [Tagetes erecta]
MGDNCWDCILLSFWYLYQFYMFLVYVADKLDKKTLFASKQISPSFDKLKLNLFYLKGISSFACFQTSTVNKYLV